MAKVGERLVGKRVETTGLGVALDLLVEPRGIERIESVAEFGELVGRQLGDGVFKVFDGHSAKIASKVSVVMAGT